MHPQDERDEEAPNEILLSKRAFLAAGLIPAAGLMTSSWAQTPGPAAPPPRQRPPLPRPGEFDTRFNSVNTCVLTPQSVEGPFYFEHKLIRSDIREDQQGTPLILNLRVTDANDCKPVSDAIVSVWQCNAEGYYSGYTFSNPNVATPPAGSTVKVPHQDPRTPERWLRGVLRADENGFVQFRTVFPSWYLPRAPHIHMKAFLKNGAEIITTQFYFPQAVLNDVLNKGIYAKRGAGMVTNENDFVRKQSGGGPTFAMSYAEDGTYVATGELGVAHI